jgi:hypothetical protein
MEAARRAMAAAEAEATRSNRGVAIAIVDSGGHLVMLHGAGAAVPGPRRRHPGAGRRRAAPASPAGGADRLAPRRRGPCRPRRRLDPTQRGAAGAVLSGARSEVA